MTRNKQTLISINNLYFQYSHETILENINLDIKAYENLAIIGRNGGGKSTLIKLILGFIKPTSGNITYFFEKNKIGYLPQIREFETQFPISIFQLVLSGLTNKKNLFRKFNKEEKQQTFDLLEEFGIIHLKDKLVSEVSGGQLQRALIGRALISNPQLLFLDEPESFLDKNFGKLLFQKIHKQKNMTLVIISHEIQNIWDYIDTVCIIEKTETYYQNKNDYLKNK